MTDATFRALLRATDAAAGVFTIDGVPKRLERVERDGVIWVELVAV